MERLSLKLQFGHLVPVQWRGGGGGGGRLHMHIQLNGKPQHL